MGGQNPRHLFSWVGCVWQQRSLVLSASTLRGAVRVCVRFGLTASDCVLWM